jgi:hypothetical protein
MGARREVPSTEEIARSLVHSRKRKEGNSAGEQRTLFEL